VSSLLVSCIMPTADRPAFAVQAVRYFLAQSYPDRELVIVERGSSPLREMLPCDGTVRHVVISGNPTIGAMRNVACQLARGDVIAHWDDDDWHGTDRLARQVAPLRSGDADITALRGAPMLELSTSQFWRCSPDLHRRIFRQDVHGGTLVYRRRVWDRLAQYPDASLAEDASFLELALRRGAHLRAIEAGRLFIYVRHATNAWSFPCGWFIDPEGWERIPEVPLPEPDHSFYRARAQVRPRATVGAAPSPATPLVTCIMPTGDRPKLASRAIEYFCRQSYPARELVILDDGRHAIEDLVPQDPSIVYYRLRERMVLGAKRNLACALARGALIAHWDDDDWMSPDRLRTQVMALRNEGADMCGAGALYFYEPATRRAWRYTYPAELGRRWVAGTSLCYTRETWARSPFAPIPVGEDTRFVLAGSWRIADVREADCVIGIVHGRNTMNRTFGPPCWSPVSAERVERILGDDRHFYDRSGRIRFSSRRPPERPGTL
jgi:glycosyltransferase involved in cell wall biosynthesis